MALILRCKTRNEVFTLSELTPSTTLKNIKMQLEPITGIKASMMKILHGFPPKPLPSTGDSAILSDLGIQSGDSLIIEILQDNKAADESVKKIKGDVLQEAKGSEKRDSGLYVGTTKQDPKLGKMIKKNIKANNSCLFASLYFALLDSRNDNDDACQVLRETCAAAVAQDPEKYSEAHLGKPNREYCDWIRKRDTWGGGIELSILSGYFGVEIVVIHTQSGAAHRFGEENNYPNRVFLIYDGVHYEPLFVKNGNSSQAIFKTDDSDAFNMAMNIGYEAKSKRQFTDLANFALKCLVCEEFFLGQKEATEHAKLTGHDQFGEV